jgi:hypothetical protein
LKNQETDIKTHNGTFNAQTYPYAYVPIQKQVYPTVTGGYETFIWCSFVGFSASHNMYLKLVSLIF